MANITTTKLEAHAPSDEAVTVIPPARIPGKLQPRPTRAPARQLDPGLISRFIPRPLSQKDERSTYGD